MCVENNCQSSKYKINDINSTQNTIGNLLNMLVNYLWNDQYEYVQYTVSGIQMVHFKLQYQSAFIIIKNQMEIDWNHVTIQSVRQIACNKASVNTQIYGHSVTWSINFDVNIANFEWDDSISPSNISDKYSINVITKSNQEHT